MIQTWYNIITAKSIEVAIEGDIQLAKTEFHSDDTHSGLFAEHVFNVLLNFKLCIAYFIFKKGFVVANKFWITILIGNRKSFKQG